MEKTEKIAIPHTCPHCKVVTAVTREELEEKFGLRNMNEDLTRNQSWCRECRKKS